MYSEPGGECFFWCSPPRGFLDQLLELLLEVGFFGLGYLLELRLLKPMGSYSAVPCAVALADLFRDHNRLEPLTSEVVSVQLLVGCKALVQMNLENILSLHAVPVRISKPSVLPLRSLLFCGQSYRRCAVEVGADAK